MVLTNRKLQVLSAQRLNLIWWFWIVGADIGYYTILFAKRVGLNGRVISFEPIPESREKLEQNIKLNGYTQVTVVKCKIVCKNFFENRIMYA